MTDKIIIFVTCGSLKEARRIARALVEERVAACVNIIGSSVESIYRWKGRIESTREVLMIIKTSRGRFGALQKIVQRMHSYQSPEMIALPVARGSRDYLDWITECTAPIKP